MNEPETSAETKPSIETAKLKHFVVALIRIQGLWLFFNAAINSTFLPTYIKNANRASHETSAYADAKLQLMMELVRVLLNIVFGILIIQYAAPFLNYLLKDADEEVKASEKLKE